MDILPEMPEIVRQYALYYRNIKGRAPKTVNEYCSDLRTFFRFMKHFRGYVSQDTPMEEILTLYPQLLPLFQNEKIQMPSEMATPIGELCKEANVDFTSFIQKCDARLRGDENNL